MKKRLEAELISIAHRLLKLKNRSETIQLHEEVKKLYEQLTILRFYEENIEISSKEISLEDLESKLENITQVETETQIVIEESIIEETVEEELIEEKIIEVLHNEETLPIEEPILEEEIEEEEIIVQNEETQATQSVLFEDVFGDSGFAEAEFVKVNDVPVEVEKATELTFEKIENRSVEEVIENNEILSKVVENITEETTQATFEEPKSMSLNDRLTKGINIGLNDRIAFEKKLFSGSSDDFNRVLSQLNTFDSFEEAKGFIDDFVKPDYNNWDGKEEFENRFLEIVEKKFN